MSYLGEVPEAVGVYGFGGHLHIAKHPPGGVRVGAKSGEGSFSFGRQPISVLKYRFSSSPKYDNM